MERWEAKMIALLGIFVIPFVCTVLPCKVSGYMAKKGEKGKKILSCLMCFGGGVFFATYILHMGPEARDILHRALDTQYDIQYPVADLLMGAGFFVVFYIEKIVIKINKRRQRKKAEKRREQCMQFNKLGQYPIRNGLTQNAALSDSERDCESQASAAKSANAKPGMANNADPMNDCPLLGTGECCNDPLEIKMQNTDKDSAKMFGEFQAEQQTEAQYEEMEAHFTRSLVLLLALSLHRIFEGMSVGLQHSIHGMANLFLAVMCHETVIGFSLGLQFVKQKMSVKRLVVASFLCSTIMPIGVAIGTMVSELGEEGIQLTMINGVLQSLATGTFIYVTFFEILQEEISPHDTSLAKVTSVLVGFSIMAALSAVPEKSDAGMFEVLVANATEAPSIYTTSAV